MPDWLERNRGYILLTLVNLVSVSLVVLAIQRPRPAPISIVTPTVAPTPTQAPLRVYVCGAIEVPDVYILAPGAIVKDALAAAGGATGEADLNQINLALSLVDGDQVYVPTKSEAGAPPLSPIGGGRTKININRASAEELDTLPGIGPALAERIIRYRTEQGPFATVEELTQVSGIGPAILANVRDLVAVR